MKLLSRVPLFATPWTVAHQAPLSMGFSRQAYWGGRGGISPWGLSDSRIKLTSPKSPVLLGGFSTTEPPVKPKPRKIHLVYSEFSLV